MNAGAKPNGVFEVAACVFDRSVLSERLQADGDRLEAREWEVCLPHPTDPDQFVMSSREDFDLWLDEAIAWMKIAVSEMDAMRRSVS